MKVEEVRAEYAALINPETLAGGRQWKTMGDIAEVVGGGTPRTSDPSNFENGDIPWLTPADLSGYTKRYVSHGARFITRKGLESSSARILPAGSVLFTSRAPIGYVAIARNPIATNQGFKSFVLKEGILPEYVYWWLKGAKQAAEGLASGTTFLELSGANAKKLPIPIVPLDQQKRIVAEIEKQFSRLDEAVANLKRVKANLKRYKAAVLKAAVEGRLVETEAELARKRTPSPLAGEGGGEGANYETGAQLLQRILETRCSQWQRKGKYKEPAVPDTTDLPELPEGWVWATVDQTAQIISGLTKNPKREALPSKYPYLRVANVYANELRLDEIEYIGVAASELEKLLLQRNDLLVVEGNGSQDQIGRVALWDGSIPNCVHQNHIIKVRFSQSPMHSWAMNWLLSPGGRQQIEQVSSSTSGLHTLSTGKVSRLPIPIPPLAEQNRIVAEADRHLSRLRETEAQVDANLQRAERLRQSILQWAFTIPCVGDASRVTQ